MSGESKVAYRCIFCSYKSGSLTELKEHSATCETHPQAQRVRELEEFVRDVAITLKQTMFFQYERARLLARAETILKGTPGNERDGD